MLDVSQLRKICPMSERRAAELLPDLVAAMREFGITSRVRVAAFLAQCGHESLDFSVWAENLNYSAAGLLKTFGKYFSISQAETYARNPKMIASRVYANRMGNGSESSNDGWTYRGRCPIQATGKDMYRWLSEKLGIDLVANPDLLLEPRNGLRAACAIFALNKNCNKLADALSGLGDPVDTAKFDRLTKAINGGLNGAVDRRQRYRRALAALPEDFTLEEAKPAENKPVEAAATASTSVKDFTKKYLSHTPTDSVKNIACVAGARCAACVTGVWNLGAHGKFLTVLIVLCVVVPVVYAVWYYRDRIKDWGTQIFEGFTGE